MGVTKICFNCSINMSLPLALMLLILSAIFSTYSLHPLRSRRSIQPPDSHRDGMLLYFQNSGDGTPLLASHCYHFNTNSAGCFTSSLISFTVIFFLSALSSKLKRMRIVDMK